MTLRSYQIVKKASGLMVISLLFALSSAPNLFAQIINANNKHQAVKEYQNAEKGDVIYWESTQFKNRYRYIIKSDAPLFEDKASLFIPANSDPLNYLRDMLEGQKQTWVWLEETKGLIDEYLFNAEDPDLHYLFAEYQSVFENLIVHGCKTFENMQSIILAGKIKGVANEPVWVNKFALGRYDYASRCAGNFGPFYIVMRGSIYKKITINSFLCDMASVASSLDSDDHLIYLVPNDQKDRLISVLKDVAAKENEMSVNINNALPKIFSFRDLINFAKAKGWPKLDSLSLEKLLKN